MKATHYYRGISNRLRLVTTGHMYRGTEYTSDEVKVSSVELRPVQDLLGKKVSRLNCKGYIVDVLTDDSTSLSGKYLGDGRYADPLASFNELVGVYWTKEILPHWQNINDLDYD